MKNPFKSFDELPLTLNATHVAQALGISLAGAYDLMHSRGFPSLQIGARILVPKTRFIEWVNQNSNGLNNSA